MSTARNDDVHRMHLEIAQAIAATWERRRPDIEAFAAPVRSWLVQTLDAHPGDTILELAAGNGDTGFEVAAQIGDRGKLITSDFAPAMLESARRRARDLGLRNVDFRVIDAHRIELDTDSVDGAICRYGFMLMVDPQAAFTETRRVLRPRGRLVLAVWGPARSNPFFTAVVGPLVRAGKLPPPDSDGPGVFRLAGVTVLRGTLEAAGFDDVRIEEIPVCATAPAVDAYLDFVADTAGPIGLTIQGLNVDERTALTDAVAELLQPYASGDRVEIPGLVLCALAS